MKMKGHFIPTSFSVLRHSSRMSSQRSTNTDRKKSGIASTNIFYLFVPSFFCPSRLALRLGARNLKRDLVQATFPPFSSFAERVPPCELAQRLRGGGFSNMPPGGPVCKANLGHPATPDRQPRLLRNSLFRRVILTE